MPRNDYPHSSYAADNYPRGYREDEELYVYDQCCENCRFY